MTQEFVTLRREVVEQALEALDSAKVWKTLNLHKLKAPHVSDAAAALRAALDQPQGGRQLESKERQAFDEWCQSVGLVRQSHGIMSISSHTDTAWMAWQAAISTRQQPQGDREPVAWIRYCSNGGIEGPILHSRMERVRIESGAWTPLYAHPQNLQCKSSQVRLATLWGYVKEQPQRVTLTDEQIGKIGRECEKFAKDGSKWFDRLTFARSIEAAHNIK